MQYRTFGHTGVDVSVLGYGAAPVGYLGVEQQKITQILNSSLDRGINLIDTAASYPGSEDAIGKAVHHRRKEFTLVSKCGHKLDFAGVEPWSDRLIQMTIDRSLGLLETDHLDVMLLHSCPLDVLKEGEAIGALVDARHRGKVRFIGYSGDGEAAAYAAQHDDIDVIETSVNIVDQANIDQVLPHCRERKLGVIAKRPIANAAWKETEEQPGFYAGYAEEYHKRFKAMGLSLSDVGFDGDPRKVWPEVAMRFTLSMEGVHSAVVGTTSTEHLDANIEAVEKGPLPIEAIERIRQTFREAEQAAGAKWVGQT